MTLNTLVVDSLEGWLDRYNLEYRVDVNLAERSHIRAGGVASLVLFPAAVDQLASLIYEFNARSLDYQVLGGASNVLFRDGVINTPLISLSKLKDVRFEADGIVEAQAGVMMPTLSLKVAKNGLGGMAGLAGVPGTIGGGVYMNASCYGSCISDHLIDVRCIDPQGTPLVLTKDMMGFQWRFSKFHTAFPNYIIVSARFELPPGDVPAELQRIKEISSHRKSFQEKGLPNLGSLFSTIDIYTDLTRKFFGYRFLYYLVKLITRFPSSRRDKSYASLMRWCTIRYFGIRQSKKVGFSNSTFNCIVNRGGANATEIIDLIERTEKAIDHAVPLENEIIKDIK